MALLDLLGRRWALRVLWELRGKPLGFRELQSSCDSMSASVLSQRLGELRHAGIVELDGDSRYALTEDGAQLLRALRPIDRWARRWGDRA
jgi:DNA-binding HxlR family transcriptional regulator